MKIEILNQYLSKFITFDRMILFEHISFLLIALYFLVILIFTIGWFKIPKSLKTNISNPVSVSIIVAFRNEEENILALIKSLYNQDYSKKHTEIILVDDHSEDNSSDIITHFINDKSEIKLLKLPDDKCGKKNALSYGISNSTSEIIITTDADCTMNKHWLSSLVNYYTINKPQLIVGPVGFHSQNAFQNFQAFEFSSLIGSGAGAIGIGKAIMCNGANLLFEKSLYKEANTHNEFASGDDVFLILHAKKKNKNNVQFLKSKNAIVYTQPAKNIRNFFNQRIRWTSKSKAYKDFDIIFTALLIALTNLTLAGSLILGFFKPHFLPLFILLFTIKSIADLGILIPTTRFFKQRKLLWYFFPLQIIYPFYITLTVIFGLTGNFNWKNRKYR